MNSCIQILSHTSELNIFLDNGEYKKRLKEVFDSVVTVEWDNLRRLMWSENCIVSPGKFLVTIQKMASIKRIEIFTGFSQNDLPEFLLFLVDCLHTSLSREVTMNIDGNPNTSTDVVAVQCFDMVKRMYSKEYSEIWSMFYGIHVSQLVSLETGEVLSSSPEPYFVTSLSIPEHVKNPTLIQCFDWYAAGEVLNGDNAWYNDKTGLKQNVQKRIVHWSFPTVLVIDLKRFNSRNQKNQILVDFPLDNLDLREYVIGYKKETYMYDLYGVCNHHGNSNGGHYTATVKTASGKWYNFNDTHVSEVRKLSDIVTPKAYCLFYRKKSVP